MSTGPLTKTLHFLPNILPQPICSEQTTLKFFQLKPHQVGQNVPHSPTSHLFPFSHGKKNLVRIKNQAGIHIINFIL